MCKKILIFIFVILAFWSGAVSKAEAGVISRPPNSLGLVGYWPFNEGTSTVSRTPFAEDYSGNGNRGTLTNMALPPSATSGWADGKLGRALNFDGSNDFVNAGDPANGSLDPQNAITVALWFKINTLSGSFPPLVKKANALLGYSLELNSSSNYRIEFYVKNSQSGPTYSPVIAGRWYHVAATYDSSLSKLYVNGVEISPPGLAISGTIGDSTSALNIGRDPVNTSRLFPGLIDEVRVYNRALSASEVAALYKSGAVKHTNPSNLGLVGYWPFNEGTSTVSRTPFAEDYSGNGNRGTLTNMSLPPTSTSGWADGKLGRALNFDGSNDYVNVTRNSVLNSTFDGSYTVSVWMKNNQQTTLDRLFGILDTSSGFHIVIVNYTSVGKATYYEGSGADINALTTTVSNLNNGSWRHLVFQLDGTTQRIYVDGVLDSSKTKVSGTSADEDFYIGRSRAVDVSDQYFKGLIDDVRIYNRALSTDEIKRLYNMGR